MHNIFTYSFNIRMHTQKDSKLLTLQLWKTYYQEFSIYLIYLCEVPIILDTIVGIAE